MPLVRGGESSSLKSNDLGRFCSLGGVIGEAGRCVAFCCLLGQWIEYEMAAEFSSVVH